MASSDQQSLKIQYFLLRLKRVYGATYKVQFPNQKAEGMAVLEWGEKICELNRPQIDAGFQTLKEKISSEYERWKFPSIGAVISLCQPKPEDFGMPDPCEAWLEVQKHSHEALEYSWSHRAVFIAGQYTGWFDIRNATSPAEQRELKKRFEKEYQRVVMRLFITGSDKPYEALENQNVELTPIEMSQRHSENIQRQVMEQQGINPKGGRSQYLSRLKAMGLSTARSRDDA